MFKLNMFKPTLNLSGPQVKGYFEHVQITELSLTQRRGGGRGAEIPRVHVDEARLE
jgi:hypothetical protein